MYDTSPSENFIWRDYSVFRKLCSEVRPTGDQSFSFDSIGVARGIPSNLASYTKKSIEDYKKKYYSLHHISYITQEEFCSLFPWEASPQDMSHFAVVGWSYVWQTLFKYRFIFGFDN